jgi:hypothetical protein
VKQTAGTWDPSQRGLSFLVGDVRQLLFIARLGYPDVLLPIDTISERITVEFEALLETAAHVILDSGVYSLVSAHARKHGIELREGFGKQPEEIDGWDALLTKYVTMAKRYGHRSWGYMELDLGGRDTKRRTREMLEAQGLAPIPVWHPFSDGWDYFDELATNYDRICVGQLVDTRANERKMILHMLWERHRDYPDLFVHLLGVSPSGSMIAYPFDSLDSSSWLKNLRWFYGRPLRVLGKPVGDWPRDFQYRAGSLYEQGEEVGDEGSHRKAEELAAAAEFFGRMSFRDHYDVMRELAPLYPPRTAPTDTVNRRSQT